MTPADVCARLEDIRSDAATGDYESAHGKEDDLHFAVLSAIATGQCSEPRHCAALAMTSADIKFARYCARYCA